MTDEAIAPIRDAYAGKVLPDLQVSTFRNMHRAFPTRVIARGGRVEPLPYRKSSIVRELEFYADGRRYDLYDMMSRNRAAALLVLKDGEVVFEDYELGNTAQTRWMSMSMAKSISTTLVGAAVHDGYIGSLDEPLTKYLPELLGGGYDGVSIRQLLQMTSGVQWNEDHTDPASERRQVLDLQVGQRPGSLLRYMARLPRVAAPGTRWNYSTGETNVVGALLHAATGRWLADYLSEKIWSRLGMEADACWWLEAPDGLEVAGSGISATLRDYARFGLFALRGGTIDGEAVVPPDWMRAAAGPITVGGAQVPYGYMWWSVPGADGAFADGAYCARGIFGQRIYLNPRERVVIVLWCARSKPSGAEVIADNDFFNAVVEALRAG